MIIDQPTAAHIPALRQLWKQAFGDSDAFLDGFFTAGYAPERCRILTLKGRLAAALYWFDCQLREERLAYLYAVATDEAFQGRGLCRALMEDTHQQLRKQGYAGAVLVPGSESLFRLYKKLGYSTFGTVREFSCLAADMPVSLRRIGAEEYTSLRRQMLPPGSILQERETLCFLQTFGGFYAGENLLFVASRDADTLVVSELLGDSEAAGGIVKALECTSGRFRAPGNDRPFAMYYPLSGTTMPAYLGLALD